MSFRVPAFVDRHRDRIVQAFIRVAERMHAHRGDLRAPLRNVEGEILLPAFPEMLARPPRKTGESAADYDRRRADGMDSFLRVLLVLIACCDWRTMEILEPSPERSKRREKYLSVARLAELAELPFDGDEPGDRTERALAMARLARAVVYTKQWREELADGRHVSTGAAKRKLGVGFFHKLGGAIAHAFDKRRDKLQRRAERRERAARAAGAGADLRFKRSMRDLLDANEAGPPELAAPEPIARIKGQPAREYLDQVEHDHPDWTDTARIFSEARRLEALARDRGGGDTS